MPFAELCTNNVSANRFEKCTVQSVEASVERARFESRPKTNKGAVYSHADTVRHGIRRPSSLRVTVRCGRAPTARRGGTNARARPGL